MSQFPNRQHYNLEERTAVFAEKIIDLVKSITINPINKRIVEQLIGCGGSIGANYCEANEAESKRDFIHKIAVSKKEIKETRHWLRLLARANPEIAQDVRPLWKESQELLLIFSRIVTSSKQKRMSGY